MHRISLSFLMLGLSLAPVLCCRAEPNADQPTAVAEMKRLGGKVIVDKSSRGKPVISVDFQGNMVMVFDPL